MINPSIGGYFRHNNLIYLAKEPTEQGSCAGCCFHRKYNKHTECDSPNALNCSGKIFQDVTENIEVELVEGTNHGRTILLTLIGAALAALAIVILYNQ
jgi:hypothetical protein